jgi:uncharacterized protein YjbI with pentapeptide repeats
MSNLIKTTLENYVRIISTEVQGIEIKDVDLTRVDLTGANLRGSKLNNLKLNSSCFEEANVSYVSFCESNLTRAKFKKAWCCQTDFTNANLSGVNFDEAYLRGSIFTGANLKGAFLEGANLTDVTGDGIIIRSTKIGIYNCAVYKDLLFIKHNSYPINQWESLEDREIQELHLSLASWKYFKAQIIEWAKGGK